MAAAAFHLYGGDITRGFMEELTTGGNDMFGPNFDEIISHVHQKRTGKYIGKQLARLIRDRLREAYHSAFGDNSWNFDWVMQQAASFIDEYYKSSSSNESNMGKDQAPYTGGTEPESKPLTMESEMTHTHYKEDEMVNIHTGDQGKKKAIENPHKEDYDKMNEEQAKNIQPFLKPKDRLENLKPVPYKRPNDPGTLAQDKNAKKLKVDTPVSDKQDNKHSQSWKEWIDSINNMGTQQMGSMDWFK